MPNRSERLRELLPCASHFLVDFTCTALLTAACVSVKASWLAEHGCDVWILTASLRSRKPFFPLSDKVSVMDLGTGDSFGPALRRYRKVLERALEDIGPDICISSGGNEIYALAESGCSCAKIAEYHFSRDKFHLKYDFPLFGRIVADWRLGRLTGPPRLKSENRARQPSPFSQVVEIDPPKSKMEWMLHLRQQIQASKNPT